MITLDKPSFIFTSEDTQTNKKVSYLIVNVNRFAVKNQEGLQGFITSTLVGDDSTSIPFSEITQNDSNFKGKDAVGELHKFYINKLAELNPNIIFTDTYNK